MCRRLALEAKVARHHVVTAAQVFLIYAAPMMNWVAQNLNYSNYKRLFFQMFCRLDSGEDVSNLRRIHDELDRVKLELF